MLEKDWSLQRLGATSYCFTWLPAAYNTVFSVGDEGVVALDPINHQAAKSYKAAIGEVTDKPIKWIIYSHEHLDHILGAEVLAPNVPIIAHRDVPGLLLYRGFKDIPLPTVLIDSYLRVDLPGVDWELYYFGPNHSRTNIAVVNRSERWLAHIDILSCGLVPFRDLPLSDFTGFRKTLDRLASFDVDTIIDGHCVPSPATWVNKYQAYFSDLVDATRTAQNSVLARPTTTYPATGIEAVRQVDDLFDAVARGAVDLLRPAYGDWGGFEAWAPMNANRALLYLITGE